MIHSSGTPDATTGPCVTATPSMSHTATSPVRALRQTRSALPSPLRSRNGGLGTLTVSICVKMSDCTPGESMLPSGGVVSPEMGRESAL